MLKYEELSFDCTCVVGERTIAVYDPEEQEISFRIASPDMAINMEAASDLSDWLNKLLGGQKDA